jgi:hypothetical protein
MIIIMKLLKNKLTVHIRVDRFKEKTSPSTSRFLYPVWVSICRTIAKWATCKNYARPKKWRRYRSKALVSYQYYLLIV